MVKDLTFSNFDGQIKLKPIKQAAVNMRQFSTPLNSSKSVLQK